MTSYPRRRQFGDRGCDDAAVVRWPQVPGPCREAEQWLLRAVLLGGERAIEPSADAGVPELTISYAMTMGVRHPAGATCVMSQPSGWEGPAAAQARQAHRAALTAAAHHAAAQAALAAVEREANTTRYRLRAVRDRWIPRLRDALAQVEFSLEELERADAARLRRAARTRPSSSAVTRRCRPAMRDLRHRAGWHPTATMGGVTKRARRLGGSPRATPAPDPPSAEGRPGRGLSSRPGPYRRCAPRWSVSPGCSGLCALHPDRPASGH